MGLSGKLVIAYMKSKGYALETYNLVGVEGVNNDGQLNKDEHDTWSDTVMVVTMSGEVMVEANGTTEPGQHYTAKPMNPLGAARMAFGQYRDCWVRGYHNGDPKHPALVQAKPVKVHRDKNKDGKRTNDKTYNDLIGLNIHGTRNLHQPNSIGRWSAGCIVIRSWGLLLTTLAKMELNKKSTYSFTLIDGQDLAKFAVDNKLQFKV